MNELEYRRDKRIAALEKRIEDRGGVLTWTPLVRGSKGMVRIPNGDVFSVINRYSHSGEAVLRTLLAQMEGRMNNEAKRNEIDEYDLTEESKRVREITKQLKRKLDELTPEDREQMRRTNRVSLRRRCAVLVGEAKRRCRVALTRLFLRLARACGASNEDVFDSRRCPACGTLDACLCAHPGAPAHARTPYEDLQQELSRARKEIDRLKGTA